MLPKNGWVRSLMVGLAVVIAGVGLFISTRPVLAPSQEIGPALVLSRQDEIAIYQAVVQAITSGRPATTSSGPIYILRITDDRAAQAGDLTGAANSVELSQATQDGISAALSKVAWIDDARQLARDPKSGYLVDGGVVVTLGNITLPSSHKARVCAAYTAGPVWGAGYIYTLEWANGAWSIVGTQQTFVS